MRYERRRTRMVQVEDAIRALSTPSSRPPTVREIAKQIGMSISRTHNILEYLRDDGRVTYESGTNRTIKLVERSNA